MRHVNLAKLEAKIIRPGFEEHLKPLLRYKGRLSLGRAHRLWNLLVSMLEHDCDTIGAGLNHLMLNPEHSQLCLPEKRVQNTGFYGFLSRLKNNPAVMGEMPHLSEYVGHIFPGTPWELVAFRAPPGAFIEGAKGKGVTWAMDAFAADHKTVLRWFREIGIEPTHGHLIPTPSQFSSWAPKETNIEIARRFGVSTTTAARWRGETGIACLAQPRRASTQESIVYPFLIHDGGKREHNLLRKVTAAVPKYLDPDLRADICQDLIVGILSGDFSEDDLTLPAQEMTKRVRAMSPSKYGPLSLDAIIPGTDNLRLIDTITDADSVWALS